MLMGQHPETGQFFLPDEDMRAFCMMLAFTGLRPGAVAALRVRDFDPRKNQLAINKDKANEARKIIVSTRTAKLLEMRCKGLGKDDLIFGITIEGKRRQWVKDLWKDRFSAGAKRCAKFYRELAAKLGDEGDKGEALDSADRLQTATLYILRHSAISEMIERGAAINVVAQLVGTSAEMIQRHYGHLSGQTRKLLDQIGF